MAFPIATDNMANTYVFGKLYTKPPLSWCLRGLALAAVAVRALPATLHLPGATDVVADRLSRGFCSAPCLAAMGLDPARRRTAKWAERSWWFHHLLFSIVL